MHTVKYRPGFAVMVCETWLPVWSWAAWFQHIQVSGQMGVPPVPPFFPCEVFTTVHEHPKQPAVRWAYHQFRQIQTCQIYGTR